MLRSAHTGLSRLLHYAGGQRGRLALIVLLAALSAAAPVAGWHLVGRAIDEGIGGGDPRRLAFIVLGYIAVVAARRSEGVFVPVVYVALVCLAGGVLLATTVWPG